MPLLRPHLLDLLRNVHELICVGLGHELPLVRLLHKVFVSLLTGEPNSILFALEVQVGTLHEIRAGLPTDQRVLPAVSFA